MAFFFSTPTSKVGGQIAPDLKKKNLAKTYVGFFFSGGLIFTPFAVCLDRNFNNSS